MMRAHLQPWGPLHRCPLQPCHPLRGPFLSNRGVSPSWRQVSASVAATELSHWPELLEKADISRLNGYTAGRSQVPKSAPSSTLDTSEHATTDKAILLYRDTDGWCPFCDRVWLAVEEKALDYDTMFINLRDKPAWYKELVPTGLVPAVKVNGKLVYESIDILRVLEDEFPDKPLWPGEPQAKKEANGLINGADALGSAGYRYLAGGSLADRSKSPPPDEAQLAELRSQFVAELQKLEDQLGKHQGPYLMGEFGVADCVYVPALERFAANLPLGRGFALRDNPHFPRLAAWYGAMDARPAYQKIKSDDVTHNLVFRKIFGVSLANVEMDPATEGARKEAAAKIVMNRGAIVDDILAKSGILRGRTNTYGGTLTSVNGYASSPSGPMISAIDWALRRVVTTLVDGTTGPKHPNTEANALGSAAVAFFMNRASAPRDMTAAAAEQLRAACLAVLKDMY